VKICVFSGFYPIQKGGAEFQSRLISDELLSKGDIVFFISINNSIEKVEYIDGFKVYFLRTSVLNKILLYFPIRLKIFKILINESPEIIYQRVLNSFSFHLSYFSKFTKTKLFIHIVDNYSLKFSINLSSLVRWVFINRIIKNKLVSFIVQSKFQSEQLNKLNIKPQFKIYNFLPNSNNVNTLKKDIKKVVWIGSARKVKRLDLFIKLVNYYSNKDYKFYIIGRMEGKYNLDYFAKKISNKNVCYLGEKSFEFIDVFLSDSYLLINTSDSEGFSNTFIHAWQKGVPVLSLNSDPDNLIESKQIGCFCNGNFSKLKDKFELLMNDELLYNRFSNNALNCSYMFSKEYSIDKLIRMLYNKNEV
jgi:hypothetical protein